MGHVNGDDGNVGFLEDVCDVGGHVLFHLELKHEVNLLADEFLCVADGDVGVLAIVEEISSTPAAAAACVTLWATAIEKGISPLCAANPKRRRRGRETSRYWPLCDCATYPRWTSVFRMR